MYNDAHVTSEREGEKFWFQDISDALPFFIIPLKLNAFFIFFRKPDFKMRSVNKACLKERNKNGNKKNTRDKLLHGRRFFTTFFCLYLSLPIISII